MFITTNIMPMFAETYIIALVIIVGLMLIIRRKYPELNKRIVPFVQGIDWVIIIIAVILLLFGAKKIPEFARSLGRATSEFKRGKLEVEKEIKESFKEESKIVKTAKDFGIKTEEKTEEQLKEEIRKKLSVEDKEENKVVKVAKDLGINTEGKTEEQLKKEIAEKLK